MPQTPIVGGDARDGSIAAASIVAKVHRDALMVRLDARVPGLRLRAPQGLRDGGAPRRAPPPRPEPVHRRSFAPVSQPALAFDAGAADALAARVSMTPGVQHVPLRRRRAPPPGGASASSARGLRRRGARALRADRRGRAHVRPRREARFARPRRSRALLARAAGVAPGDVGYAGRKDRVAVARQWLSVPGARSRTPRSPSRRRACACSRRGATRTSSAPDSSRGNRFRLRVRDVDRRAPRERRSGARRARSCARGLAEPLRRAALRRRRRATPSAPRRASPASGAWPATAATRASCSRRSRPPSSTTCSRAARCPSTRVEARRRRGRLRERRALPRRGRSRASSPRAARFEISATGPDLRHAHDRGRRRAGRAGARVARALRHRPRDASGRPAACAPAAPVARSASGPRASPSSCRARGDVELRFVLPPGSYATVLVEALLGATGAAPSPGSPLVPSRPRPDRRGDLHEDRQATSPS